MKSIEVFYYRFVYCVSSAVIIEATGQSKVSHGNKIFFFNCVILRIMSRSKYLEARSPSQQNFLHAFTLFYFI
jgi:hypothetical protein